MAAKSSPGALYNSKSSLGGLNAFKATPGPLSWGANLYTYIGPMALKSSILATWQAGRWNYSNCNLNRKF